MDLSAAPGARSPRQILSELRASLPSFSNSDKERSVVEFLLMNPSEIATSTISQIAGLLDVSESTIVKVCKKLGYEGFKDVRRAFTGQPIDRTGYIRDEVNADDDEAAVCEKVFKTALNTIQDTFSVLDTSAMKAGAGLIKAAHRVLCYGLGGSAPLALDAHHKLLLTGFQTAAYTDSHFIAMSASQLRAGDVAIVYSFSGETSALNTVVRMVRERGVKSIAITCHRGSTLTRVADVVLFAALREHPLTGENSAVRLAQKVVFDCLLSCAVKDQPEKVEAAYRRALEAVNGL